MKCKHFLLTVIAMLCWVALAQAAIIASLEGRNLIVETDQKGVTGYKGCDAVNMEKMPAYVFELQERNNVKNGICPTGRGGRWETIVTQPSDEGRVIFENLPDGNYRIFCRVAKAIGCKIKKAEDGYPDRSIVYELEKSTVFELNTESRKQSEFIKKVDEKIMDGLTVYPNPAFDEITIVLESNLSDSEIFISILDLLGKTIHLERHVLTEQNDLQWKINVRELPAGTYIVMLRERNGKLWQEKFGVIRK